MRKGLGRGLDAILGGETVPEAVPVVPEGQKSGVQTVGISRLVPNRFQPRADFNDEGLEELANSIRAQGVIQPLVVARGIGDGYTIIAGERRWRAAQKCGLTEVPVIVREAVGDRELLELALVENLQRADLNSIEEAEAFLNLQDRFGLTQDEIAERVGRARSTITNSLRLLRLPDEVKDLLRGGDLSAGQARPLLGLESASDQIRLARRAASSGLSARRVEAMVGREAASKKASVPDVHTAAAEGKLTRALQTRVEIKRSGKGGTIRVHFGSEDELIRIYDHILGD